LFAASLVAYVLFWRFNVQFMIRDRMEEAWPLIMVKLGGSNSFASDYILTAIVAANFIALPGIAAAGRLLMPLKRLCAAAASCTLTLYLFHMPVLILLLSLYGRWDGLWRPLSILALLLAVMPLLALLTEHRLGEFRRLLRRAAMIIHALAGRMHGRTLLPGTPAE
jgi:peptidoglycan/LPS O-acetylase OafA/YrhL